MGKINGMYLKRNGTVIAQSNKEAIILLRQLFPLCRSYYFLVIKMQNKYVCPKRIKGKEFDYYYKKLNSTKW